MPKKAKELSALAVSKIKAEGRYAVGGADGLHLRIVGESRAWVLRIKVGERRCDIGLGGYPDVSLADAREAAREHRKAVRGGIDPLEVKRQSRTAARVERVRAKTFRECAEAFIEIKSKELNNAKHIAQWGSTLKEYAYPFFGDKIVGTITKDDIYAALEPIWLIKNETASRLRGRIENVLDYAKAKEYREGDNPASWKGPLSILLPKPSKVQKVEHHASLPYAEIGAFMAALRQRDGMSARALEFGILCAARSGEIRGATWPEIDLSGRVWVIPAERMKAGKEHRVPLTDAAVAILEAVPRMVGSDFVFPAPRGGALSDMSLTAVLKRMDRGDLTQHGFRSTFREWAGETTAYPREVIEHALAHQLRDKTEAAYQRGTLWPKRVHLMTDWAKFCATVKSDGDNVVPIMKGAAS